MKSIKKYLVTKKHLIYSISILFGCIITLVIVYIINSREGFDNSRRPPFLYKERYNCNDPHLMPAFNPEICCRMVNGKLKCDYNRNCRCKSKRTGICETCYPAKKKNI